MGEYVFDTFADEYGPEKICYVTEPRVGLQGIVVIDNTAARPGDRRDPDGAGRHHRGGVPPRARA